MALKCYYLKNGDVHFVTTDGYTYLLDELDSDDYKVARNLKVPTDEGVVLLVDDNGGVSYDLGGNEVNEAIGSPDGDVEPAEVTDGDADGVSSGDVSNGAPEDGDGDGQGEAEGEAEGDGQGEAGWRGPEDSDGMSDPSYDQSGDPSSDDEPLSDNPIAADLYDSALHEVIVQIAEDRSTQAAQHTFRSTVSYVMNRLATGDGSTGDVAAPEKIRVEIPKRSEGDVRHYQYDTLMRALMVSDVYIPGPPGTGKSHVAEQVANDLGRPFTMLACSPLDTPAKWFGYVDANGVPRLEVLYTAFTEGHIMLIDEMDNSNPSMITGVNSLIANRKYSFPGVGLVEAHPDFRLVATANTYGTGPTAEFAGRCRLDPATLDRFTMLPMGVDEGIETILVENILGSKQADKWLRVVRSARRAVEGLRIRHFVTMRGAIEGAKLISAGFSVQQAYDMRIVGTLPDDHRQKIKAYKG